MEGYTDVQYDITLSYITKLCEASNEEIRKFGDGLKSCIKYLGKTIDRLEDIDNLDDITYIHSLKVSLYCGTMGKMLGAGDKCVEKLIQAGLIHDIGKLRIPREIINKIGLLTRDEYECIKRHTNIGYSIIKDEDWIDEEIKLAVLNHHERLTGDGYNNSLLDIDFVTQIVSVADSFEAMTSVRTYNRKKEKSEAINELYNPGCGLNSHIIKAVENIIVC